MKKVKVVKPKEHKEKTQRTRRKFPVKALPFLALIAVAVAVLAWALPMLPQKPVVTPQAGYQGVVELWNVEAFEGGSGSRASWLTSKAAKFEAANRGLFVHVTTLTVEQLKQKLEDQQSFDIICFSRGAGNIVKDKLVEITADMGAVRDNLVLSAQMDGKQYAAPLYCGAYCLFARESQLPQENLLSSALSQTYTRKIGKNTFELQPLVCGFTAYNSPLSALALSGGKGKAKVNETVTQYQAYEQFVDNKTAVTLLGTQRDLYRLSKKEADGKIDKLGFLPLTGYTDLAQYLGISADSGDKMNSCKAFVEYLLSKDVQSSLVNLSLFSVLDEEFYTMERYSACERALSSAYVPNVFGDEEAIANQRQTAIRTLNL